MKKVYLIIFSIIVVLAGCGSSIESKARDTFKKFDGSFQNGHTFIG